VKALQYVLLAGLAALPLQGTVAASDVADAVMQRDAARVQRLLKSHADVNEAQPDGSTALHWAAYQGDPRTTASLLAAGANPGAVTDTGMTPLLLACEAGNAQLVEELLRAGADVNQTLRFGETPLMMAARTGSVPVLKLLLAHGASIDAREKKRGTTALMWAAANGNPQAVRFLLSKGADKSARSGTTDPGRRPYLAQTGRERISEFAGGYGLAGLGRQAGHGYRTGEAAGGRADRDGEKGARFPPAAEATTAQQEALGWAHAAAVRHPAG
jgi:hypothetical protein